jgi:NAD(P)-dependent dehydrogenase (short-subunit alcohol dehydrogenase family)
MLKRLQDRSALVTGAARGIGRAIVERLIAEGANVLMCDIDEATLKQAAHELGQPYKQVDVAQVVEVGHMIEAAIDHFGALDILVNNAGMTHESDLLTLEERDFDRVMAVNLKSMLFATQAAARHMIPRRRGAIVNLSSVTAVLAHPMQIPYVISKAAVKQATNVTAIALAPHNIRVNAVGPGTIESEMSRSVLAGDAVQAMVRSRTPLGRFGKPEEIAATVAFLASDDASYITGQTIYVEGGRLGLNYTM